ncbi:MAG: pantetheine-phosphate adenylyltransferase [Planctomycetes bacterium]|nr:pantetheine-phosphate adenylyltransferase [Planctomycetota bacterium]
MHVVYPGSFDPLTMGHVSIVERAAQLFDQVSVLISYNPEKASWFSAEERVEQVQTVFAKDSRVKVDLWSGLLVEYAKVHKIDAIVKGVRSAADLSYEQVMAEANHQIGEGLETVVLLAPGALQGVSSSLVRQIHSLGGDVSAFVPPSVLEKLKQLK